jgi:hypothetical protein
VREAAPAAAVATAVLLVAIAPEAGRMVSFAGFETFDPAGAGLGNLFDRLSPLETLGVWPSGDFRVEPGGGAVPAAVFYLGAALALAAFGYGIRRCARNGERVLLATLAAATALWLYGLVAGTPYQEAKALVILAPVAMLVSVRGILATAPDLVEARGILERRSLALLFPGRARLARERLVVGVLGALFLAVAAGSSVLALINGPVGPSGYSPELAELRHRLPAGSTLVLAPPELLDEQHGRDYLVWELRANRICVAEVETAATTGIRTRLFVTLDEDGAVVPEFTYTNRGAVGPGPCALVSETGRADPAGDD